jgi:hypothetical protein
MSSKVPARSGDQPRSLRVLSEPGSIPGSSITEGPQVSGISGARLCQLRLLTSG